MAEAKIYDFKEILAKWNDALKESSDDAIDHAKNEVKDIIKTDGVRLSIGTLTKATSAVFNAIIDMWELNIPLYETNDIKKEKIIDILRIVEKPKGELAEIVKYPSSTKVKKEVKKESKKDEDKLEKKEEGSIVEEYKYIKKGEIYPAGWDIPKGGLSNKNRAYLKVIADKIHINMKDTTNEMIVDEIKKKTLEIKELQLKESKELAHYKWQKKHDEEVEERRKKEAEQNRQKELAERKTQITKTLNKETLQEDINEKKWELQNGYDLKNQDWTQFFIRNVAGIIKATTFRNKYNYNGPGTDLRNAVRKDLKPTNDLDKLAFAHDFEFLDAGLLQDKDEREHAEYIADAKFMTGINNLYNNTKDEDLKHDIKWTQTWMTKKMEYGFHFVTKELKMSDDQKREISNELIKQERELQTVIPKKKVKKESKKPVQAEIKNLDKNDPEVILRNKIYALQQQIVVAPNDTDTTELTKELKELQKEQTEIHRKAAEKYFPMKEEEKKEEDEEDEEHEELKKIEKEILEGYERKAINISGAKAPEEQIEAGEELPGGKYYIEMQKKSEALKQYGKSDISLAGVRFGDKVVSGSRSMRAAIDVRLGKDYVKLTPDEKARNVAFYSNLNFVKVGNGNGNQQILPFSYKGWSANNRLFELDKKAEHLRYSGHLNNGNIHIEKVLHPSIKTQNAYGLCMIPQSQHNQAWMALNPSNYWRPSDLGKPLIFNRENAEKPNMFNQVYSRETRLYNGNVINGGIRI